MEELVGDFFLAVFMSGFGFMLTLFAAQLIGGLLSLSVREVARFFAGCGTAWMVVFALVLRSRPALFETALPLVGLCVGAWFAVMALRFRKVEATRIDEGTGFSPGRS